MKTNLRYVSVYIFYLLFPFKMTSNSILFCTRQSKACRISSLAATDDIFLVGGIDKVIKPIIERIR